MIFITIKILKCFIKAVEHWSVLPIDIISTNTSSLISSAAKAAHMPEIRVAIAGVPVAGQTWLRLLKDKIYIIVRSNEIN